MPTSFAGVLTGGLRLAHHNNTTTITTTRYCHRRNTVSDTLAAVTPVVPTIFEYSLDSLLT